MKKYSRNPRKIDPQRLARLRDTLLRLGDLSGVVHNLTTDEIIGGNQRMEIFQGGKVEIVRKQKRDAQGTVAIGFILWKGKRYGYRQVKWNEKTAAEANIAANLGAGEWDWAVLKKDFSAPDLKKWGFDFTALRNWQRDLEELGSQLGVAGGAEAPEPEAGVPIADTEPRIEEGKALAKVWDVRRGDFWAIGDHRLLCGNATDAGDLERLGGPASFDIILTDPPYCSGGFQEAGKARGSIGTKRIGENRKEYTPRIANDALSSRGYCALIRAVLQGWRPPFAYVFTDWRMWVQLFDVMESSGLGVRNMLVWDKGSPGMGRGWRAQHELVMFGAAAKPEFDNHKAVGNVLRSNRTGNPNHPTEKPVDLLSKILEVSEFGQLVADPFLGSGSTMVACQNLGRVCLAMEIEPNFCAVTLQRMADTFPDLDVHRIDNPSGKRERK